LKLAIPIVAILLLAASDNSVSQDTSEVEFDREEISFDVEQFAVVGDLLTPPGDKTHPLIIYVWGSGPTNRRGHIERSRLLENFIAAGYAVFLDDKPGSGTSTGEFSSGRLLHERAAILAKEIEILREHGAVDPECVGLYGSSQAAYVMSLAFEKTADIAFMIAWSCPAMNSLEQSAYLVKNYLLCEGLSVEEAEKAERFFIQRGEARNYQEYLEAAEYIDGIPAVSEGLEWGGVIPEDEYVPEESSSEYFFDPSDMLAGLEIPVLAVFGENDKQIDPVQGAETYERLLRESGDGFFEVRTIPGVDHNMIISETGCIQDQQDNYKNRGGAIVSPDFYEVIDRWLEALKVYLDA
jgi:pimeloyl-ACP methyl ester carboxylesterase